MNNDQLEFVQERITHYLCTVPDWDADVAIKLALRELDGPLYGAWLADRAFSGVASEMAATMRGIIEAMYGV